MGKEFKNIDELYRSELGGAITEAPASVKGNIDSALGFGKRKAGFLFLGIIALLTTVGITAVVLTNMDGVDQVAQSDIIDNELNESLNNSMNSSFSPSDPTSDMDQLENRTNAADKDERITNGNEYKLNADRLNVNNTNENSSNVNSNSTSQNYRTRNTISTLNKRSRISTNSPTVGLTANETVQYSPVNSTSANNSSGMANDGIVADNAGNFRNAGNNGTTKPTRTNNGNIGSNNTSGLDNTSNPPNNGNLGNNKDNSMVDPSDQTNIDNGSTDNSDNLASFVNDGANDNPNQLVNAADTTLTTDNDLAIVDKPEVETAHTDKDTVDTDSTATLTNPAVIDPLEKDDYKPLMLSLTSGVNLLRSNYSSLDMSEETLYDNALNDNIGNQTNLDITYRLKNGLTFGTGFGINNYNESYEFTTYESFIDTTEIFETVINEYEYEYAYYYSMPIDSVDEIEIDTILFIKDSTAFPVDTVYTYAYDNGKKGTVHNGINKATYFTIPVHFGTQIMIKKFQLDLYASARFNFLTRSSGGYFGDNEVKLFGKENSIYKPFYVDVLFASKIHYNFYKNLFLTGTVQYRPVMGNSFKDVSFNKTFDYMHFGLGLSIRL